MFLNLKTGNYRHIRVDFHTYLLNVIGTLNQLNAVESLCLLIFEC